MVCLLPLLAVGSPLRLWGIALPWGSRGRTWLALFGASLLAIPLAQFGIFGWAAIDAVAAAAVMKRPRGEAQRAIGLLFVAMLFAHLGFYIATRMQPGPRDYTAYVHFNSLLGWLQWACLLSWGIGDALERLRRTSGAGGDILAGAGADR